MRNRVLPSLTLLALAGLTSLALAADPDDVPAQVGRVALTQGQVSIADDVGAEMTAAQVNWPVTSGNMISTAPGARTELRIGSTSIRLDGDSSLEVLQLDDATLRLRLHYGSANIRVRNPDLLPGFELTTAQARIQLQQPGSLRIDAERVRDTSSVNVFDGVALVDGGGSQLTVRAGKGAELADDDVRTLAARRDAFDDWSAGRDRIEETSVSARYVGTEMTGYEDLDRYGSWSTDAEYGPIWLPTVATTWVPYRDGSWTWLDPWGWTWVDNAPWGYAPFHYGRWIQVRNRWAWAPGRREGRPVWAPALVGWVGGAGWNITFRDRTHGPGFGWYPLSWHDRYVPGYRAPDKHLRWLNGHVRNDPRGDRRDNNRDRGRDFRPQGLTVVPQDRFRQPGRINVARAPIATAPPVLNTNVGAGGLPLASAPPAPPNRPQRGERPGGDRRDGDRGGDDRRFGDRGDRGERGDQGGRFEGRRQDGRTGNGQFGGGRIDTGRIERDGFVRQRPGAAPAPLMSQTQSAQGLSIVSPPPRQSPQAGTIVSPPPRQPAPALTTTVPPQGVPQPGQIEGRTDPRTEWRSQGWQRSDRREQMEEMRRNRPSMPAPVAPAPAPAAVLQAAPQPIQEARSEPRFEQRPDRGRRGDWERPAQQRIAPPAPAPAPAPAAIAPPPRPAMPAPPPVAAARPAPAPRAEPVQHARPEPRAREQRER